MIDKNGNTLRAEKNLINLLVGINALEKCCKTLHSSEAVPPAVYTLFGKLRDEIAAWGTRCIIYRDISNGQPDNDNESRR